MWLSLSKLGLAAEWEDDDVKNMGVAALGLFSISLIYVFFSQIMRLTLKLDKEKERNIKFKGGYLKILQSSKKTVTMGSLSCRSGRNCANYNPWNWYVARR